MVCRPGCRYRDGVTPHYTPTGSSWMNMVVRHAGRMSALEDPQDRLPPDHARLPRHTTHRHHAGDLPHLNIGLLNGAHSMAKRKIHCQGTMTYSGWVNYISVVLASLNGSVRHWTAERCRSVEVRSTRTRSTLPGSVTRVRSVSRCRRWPTRS